MEWKDLKRMTRVVVKSTDFVSREYGNFHDRTEVLEILRIMKQEFNNYERNFLAQAAQLHTDCWQILSNYAEMITQTEGFSTLQDIREDRATDSEAFFFAFSSN